MSVNLTCPVCDRSQIETNTCPNCETDLSTYRMLAQLPVETPIQVKESNRNIPIWLPVGVAGLFLLLGVGLGFAGNTVIARQQPQTTPTSTTTVSNPIPETKVEKEELVTSPVIAEKPQKAEPPQLKSCDGFKYVVRRGDSLSLVASRFYGDSNLLSLISNANPQLQGKENLIKIGEALLIPNREANCP
jgi:LysM repeat protein